MQDVEWAREWPHSLRKTNREVEKSGEGWRGSVGRRRHEIKRNRGEIKKRKREEISSALETQPDA